MDTVFVDDIDHSIGTGHQNGRMGGNDELASVFCQLNDAAEKCQLILESLFIKYIINLSADFNKSYCCFVR